MRGAIVAAAALGWLATVPPAEAAAQIGCFSDGDFVFLHVGNIYQFYVDKGDPRVDCTPDAVRIGLELTDDEAQSLCARQSSLCQEKKANAKLIRDTYPDLLRQSGYVEPPPSDATTQGQAAPAEDAAKQSAAATPDLDLKSRDTIRFVQKSLERLGYKTGGADGAFGKRTAAAIRKFEKDNGMRVTGKISKTLIAGLQEKVGPP